MFYHACSTFAIDLTIAESLLIITCSTTMHFLEPLWCFSIGFLNDFFAKPDYVPVNPDVRNS
jgi:hypothetical protein